MIKSRRIRWPGHVTCVGRGMHRVLVGKPEGRAAYMWDDNIKIYPTEIGWGVIDRDQWRAFVNREINLWI
jgi:hypothetical protein